MKITILLIVLLIVLLLFTTNIIVVKKMINLKNTDTLKKHLEIEVSCPRLNGSYKQCTDTGTYRHSLDGIKQNHLVYKNNPRVNIWNTTN